MPVRVRSMEGLGVVAEMMIFMAFVGFLTHSGECSPGRLKRSGSELVAKARASFGERDWYLWPVALRRSPAIVALMLLLATTTQARRPLSQRLRPELRRGAHSGD